MASLPRRARHRPVDGQAGRRPSEYVYDFRHVAAALAFLATDDPHMATPSCEAVNCGPAVRLASRPGRRDRFQFTSVRHG
jgi:hypothetical protein